MNTAKYPLLIQGLYSDPQGVNSTLNILGGTNVYWSNNITIGRGDVEMIDIVTSQIDFIVNGSGNNLDLGLFNLTVGSIAVIQNGLPNEYIITSLPRSREIMPIKVSGGQSIALGVQNTWVDPYGMFVHLYFTNQYGINPAIIAARNNAGFKQRNQSFKTVFPSGQRYVSSGNLTVPKSIGNVVAVQFFAMSPSASELAKAIITVKIGGTDIIQNACAGLFLPYCARPGLIFPILVRGGETFELTADTRACANDVTFVAKFYFDDDLNGTKQY